MIQNVTCLIEYVGKWGKMGEIVGFYWVDLRIRDSRIENCIKTPIKGVQQSELFIVTER